MNNTKRTMRIHIHPGKILQEEFLFPLGLSANALSREIGVPTNRITQIIASKRAVTPDTALRLARYFNTTPQFWLNLQQEHDLSETLVKYFSFAFMPMKGLKND